ncbi:MAG TPA: UrcA family protein [Steroidobacteraceae bacterium]|jgi:UrcA family protein|nr:UrcA family protein [Steroidobacteraceae bacterium]
MDTCKNLLRLCLAGTALVALAGVAVADEAYGVHKVTVHYGDLNLNTEIGAQRLFHRIGGAATYVCGEEGRRLEEQREWQDCYHEAVDHAVDTVHSPLVSTLNKGHVGHGRVTAALITMVR